MLAYKLISAFVTVAVRFLESQASSALKKADKAFDKSIKQIDGLHEKADAIVEKGRLLKLDAYDAETQAEHSRREVQEHAGKAFTLASKLRDIL